MHTLLNPIGGADDAFGYGVTISADRAAVSILNADRQFSNAGAVAVYSVTTGQLEALIDNPNPTANDYFGWSTIRLAGDTLVVGAVGEDRPVTESGAAYIYKLQDSRLSL